MDVQELVKQAEKIRQIHLGKERILWPEGFKSEIIKLIHNGQTARSLSEATSVSHQWSAIGDQLRNESLEWPEQVFRRRLSPSKQQ